MVQERLTRSTFVRRGGAVVLALAGGEFWADAAAAHPKPKRRRRLKPKPKPPHPIKHVIVSCQENRSFDHYYGYAQAVQAAGFGPPQGFTQPDGGGGSHAPFEFSALSTPDPPHFWPFVHTQVDGGKMDGFYIAAQNATGDGRNAIGYYTERELPFYYSLFTDSALCANYFCSVRGPTWPNRFYLMSGTAGGITTNGVWGTGIFNSASWPIILDLLEDAHLTWKVYNAGTDDLADGDNVSVFWSR